jgi:hypothetical protein
MEIADPKIPLFLIPLVKMLLSAREAYPPG